MKKTLTATYRRLLMTLSITLFTILSVPGQINAFEEIMSSKNYAELSTILADEIDLCIMDDTQINTKAESMERLRVFLNPIKINSFKKLHNDARGGGSSYTVYKLTTLEKQLRVFIYYEKVGATDKITELRIDKF